MFIFDTGSCHTAQDALKHSGSNNPPALVCRVLETQLFTITLSSYIKILNSKSKAIYNGLMHRNGTQGENTLNSIHQILLEKREVYEGKKKLPLNIHRVLNSNFK